MQKQISTASKNHPVFPYLISCISEEIEGTTAERIQEVLRRFEIEYNYPDNKKRYPNLQARFAEWLMGLPCLQVDFYHFDMIKLAKAWGALPENATEKQCDKITENWFSFMACKWFQLCKFNKVDYSGLY